MCTRKKISEKAFFPIVLKETTPTLSHQQCDDPLVSSQKPLENGWGHVLHSALPQRYSGRAKKRAVLLGRWGERQVWKPSTIFQYKSQSLTDEFLESSGIGAGRH